MSRKSTQNACTNFYDQAHVNRTPRVSFVTSILENFSQTVNIHNL